jgi:predicted RNA binding protein YcfA (HicA-like mRNA interferase family)
LIPVNASKYVKTLQLEGWHQLTQTQNSSKFVKLDGFCQLMLQNASAFLKKNGSYQLIQTESTSIRPNRWLIPVNASKCFEILKLDGWCQLMFQNV